MRSTALWIGALALFFAASAEGGAVPVFVEATALTRGAGHWRTVEFAAFSPDGETLATIGGDDLIVLRDVDTGRVKTRFFSPSPDGNLAFSPDGAEFAHGDYGDDILIRDAKTGTLKAELEGHERSIHALIYGKGGKTLFSAGDGLWMWDVKKRELVKSLSERTKTYTALTLSSDSQTIAAATRIRVGQKYEPVIELRNSETGALKKQIVLSDIYSIDRLSFSPDSSKIAAGSSNGATLWDVETGGQIDILGEDSGSRLIQFLPDGERIAFFLDGFLTARDLKTGERVHIVSVTSPSFKKVLSSNGDKIAFGFFFGGIQIWNMNDGSLHAAFGGNDTGPIYSAAFSRDGKTLALGCADGGVRLWDVPTQRFLRKLWQAPYTYYSVESVDFSKDGKTVAGANHVDIALWDVKTGHFKRALGDEYRRDHRNYSPVVYSPDGKTIASMRYRRRDGGILMIELRDADTGEATKKITVENHLSWGFSMTYSPDGQTIAYNGSQFFDVETGRLRETVKHHSGAFCLAYSPDGQTFAVGHWDGAVTVWNAQTYKRIMKIQAHTDSARSVAYSPDGGTLASGSDDGQVRLWKAETGELKAILRGHTGRIYALAYSPDGRFLVSGSDDSSALLWNLSMSGDKPIQWAEIRLPDEAADGGSAPSAPSLLPNYPNPFNPETWIPFDLSETSRVRISIYNEAGELTRELNLGTLPPGAYRSRQKAAYWDGRNALGERAASGIYFARIQTGMFTAQRRMLLLK